MAEQGSKQQREQLLLSHWGLPKPVLAAFAKKGLTQLYEWQAAALECATAGNNLVYCAPTSGEMIVPLLFATAANRSCKRRLLALRLPTITRTCSLSMPVAGGKSLVAEVLMVARMHKAQQALQQVQQGRHKQQAALPRGLLVLPYLSIVAEKTAHLSILLEGMKWRVAGYRGESEGQPLASKVGRAGACSRDS
jgi:DNA polymerase theta